MRFVLATRNAHKAQEYGELLAGHEVVALPADVELPPEDGQSFAENALGKARAAAAALGVPALGDDSGIESEDLGGAPGIYSARYAGPDATDAENVRKLLSEAPAGSRVSFACALAFVDPVARREEVVVGRCHGHLAAAPRGAHGFGYDPVFVPVEHPDRTMAELEPAEKDAISHRGRAAAALLERLGGEGSVAAGPQDR